MNLFKLGKLLTLNFFIGFSLHSWHRFGWSCQNALDSSRNWTVDDLTTQASLVRVVRVICQKDCSRFYFNGFLGGSVKVIFQAFWRFVWMYAIFLNISKMLFSYF